MERRLGALQATALNMVNMIGIGPFITIPLLMSTMGGPQALLGWAAALVLVVCDGMIWSELGAAMPEAGGSYLYLRQGLGPRWGPPAAFLFLWQFVLSGPLEIASGYIGIAGYLGYLWPGRPGWAGAAAVLAVGALNVFLLWRPTAGVGRITIALWGATLLTAAAVVATGAIGFDARRAFDFPPGAFDLSLGFFLGLGASARVGVYDYLGYYDVCYVAGEVRDPGRALPRAVLGSVVVVALIYFAINLAIIGVVPWRQMVPAGARRPLSDFVVSIVMERVWGGGVAAGFTLLVVVTAFASVFALLYGYSRIPYAAAHDGAFFRAFASLHPRGGFPHVSLLVLGALAIAGGLLPLDAVIGVLLTLRIIVQFIGQAAALVALRRRRPDLPRPYRVWLYPLPCALAVVGWLFLFLTSEPRVVALALAVLAAGVVAYRIRARRP